LRQPDASRNANPSVVLLLESVLIGMLQPGAPPAMHEERSVVFAQKYVNEKSTPASGVPFER
jgi:hypothetical protein